MSDYVYDDYKQARTHHSLAERLDRLQRFMVFMFFLYAFFGVMFLIMYLDIKGVF